MALNRGMPWPVSRNVRPGWVPAGIVSRTLPLSVVDLDLGAQEGLLEGQRQLAFEVRAAAGERLVGQDLDDDHEVAATGTALAQLDPAAGVGAGRDRDLEPLAIHLDQPGRPVERLGQGQLGGGLVGRWWRWRRPSGRLGPPGRGAVDAHPAQDVLEAHAAGRPGAPPGRPGPAVGRRVATEEDVEEVREVAVGGGPELVADVVAAAEALATEAGVRVPAAGRARLTGPADGLPVRAELVVLLALGRIAEDLVGLVDLLELVLGGGVAGLGVRVVLTGQLPERLLDLSG